MKRLIISESEKRNILKLHYSNNKNILEQNEITPTNVVPNNSQETPNNEITAVLQQDGVSKEEGAGFCTATAPPPRLKRMMDRLKPEMKENAKTFIKNFFNKVKDFSLKDLLSLRTEIKQKKQNAKNNVQEQIGEVIILGMAISSSLLIAIAGIIIFVILMIIIIKSSGGGGKSCNPGWWDNL